jgi:hypothetical protein
MKRRHEKVGAERGTAKTVRFTAVVAKMGTPKVYLPFSDPKNDRTFMRAVKENRVLTIHQEPASRRSDFGTVGFDGEKYASYLIFPKSLTQFANTRVIGIKYNVLGESSFMAGPPPPTRKSPEPKLKNVRIPPAAPPQTRPAHIREELNPRTPPKRVESQPKDFLVRVRVTTEKSVTVRAITKAEAKDKAQAAVENEGDVRVTKVIET